MVCDVACTVSLLRGIMSFPIYSAISKVISQQGLDSCLCGVILIKPVMLVGSLAEPLEAGVKNIKHF